MYDGRRGVYGVGRNVQHGVECDLPCPPPVGRVREQGIALSENLIICQLQEKAITL